jgi:hypothetical protein
MGKVVTRSVYFRNSGEAVNSFEILNNSCVCPTSVITSAHSQPESAQIFVFYLNVFVFYLNRPKFIGDIYTTSALILLESYYV